MFVILSTLLVIWCCVCTHIFCVRDFVKSFKSASITWTSVNIELCLRVKTHCLQTPAEYRRLLGYRSSNQLAASGGSRQTRRQRRRRQVSIPAMPVYANTVDVSTLPATVNWTASGWVGPVMDQVMKCWIPFHSVAILHVICYCNSGRSRLLNARCSVFDMKSLTHQCHMQLTAKKPSRTRSNNCQNFFCHISLSGSMRLLLVILLHGGHRGPVQELHWNVGSTFRTEPDRLYVDRRSASYIICSLFSGCWFRERKTKWNFVKRLLYEADVQC